MYDYEKVMVPIGAIALCITFFVRFGLPIINGLLFSLGVAFLGTAIFIRAGIPQRTLKVLETVAERLARN